MRTEAERLSKLQTWLLAIRPKTLPTSASPVIIGCALALSDSNFTLGSAFATLLTALLLQMGANLANDYYDYQGGIDTHERLGPTRVTQAGLLKPFEVLAGMWLTFILAAILGLYLASIAGWPVLVIGILTIAAAIAYTGGPIPLGYYGFGDLLVFVFFGIAAVGGTYYIQVGEINWLVVLSSIPPGLLVIAVLVVNNLRDINTDRATGKRTLAVRLGVTGTRLEYLICVVGAYLVVIGMWIGGFLSFWVLVILLSLPEAISIIRMVYTVKGRKLNNTLARTSLFTLFFSLLFSVGILLA